MAEYTEFTQTNGPTISYIVNADRTQITLSLESLEQARDYYYDRAFQDEKRMNLYPLGKAHFLDAILGLVKK